MGMFDIRCGVSGLSNFSLTGDYEYVSMSLLLERNDELVPLTPPLTGYYSRYGDLADLGSRPRPEVLAHAATLGRRLRKAWDEGRLTSTAAKMFDRDRARREQHWDDPLPDDAVLDALAFFSHGAERVWNKVDLRWEGKPVFAWFYLEPVADAIVQDRGLPSIAEARASFAEPELTSELSSFGEGQVRRLAAVVAHTQNWLGPVVVGKRKGDGHQHSEDQVRRYVKSAWNRDDEVVRELIETRHPDWVKRWRRAEMEARLKERSEPAPRAAAPKTAPKFAQPQPYSPRTTFEVGDVVDHPKFGRGRVTSAGPDRIAVKFDDQERTLVHGR